ncbi:MAG: alpha-D-glucose phosphate-specific phosphoglucomutase [Betaproteobacteria bacterium]|nr:alpha-D-glucose phosphate-specific phosphoglucomutase [Betaproteobacteria bacterium]
MEIHPSAGKPAAPDILVDVPKLLTAYYTGKPDPSVVDQRVSFGTSGHRGSALGNSFNENHILAVTQAICLYRQQQGINGPLYLGIDTHALSTPAGATALEVLAANGVEVMIAEGDEYTPTPVISHAILGHNRGRRGGQSGGLADGIVVTPSHNPPKDGGFKYNPTNGGPADTAVTRWIQDKANELLEAGLAGVKRVPLARALAASTTHRHDYLGAYVGELGQVLDMPAIRGSGLKLGVDPLGGAGVHYWARIAEQYGLDLRVVNPAVDPTFRFMTADWDGQIRMDPSSSYAMQGLIGMKEHFDICFACDTDHDRHGIVTRAEGLLPTNHYLAAAVSYLFQNRPQWPASAAVGKTVVSSQIIDRIAAKLGRRLYEVPVGFKYFAAGLEDGSLAFGCEESAGASFARMDGSVWTTDKDGITACLLSAEIAARSGMDPGALYRKLANEFGDPLFERVEAPANRSQKAALEKLSPQQVQTPTLAGEKIQAVLTRAPGNDAAIGGLKVTAENGWFAARPSGTEDIYKIYAESYRSREHLKQILEEAQAIVTAAVTAA